MTMLYGKVKKAIASYKRLPKGLHNITPTQQTQFKWGLTIDDILFFCQQSIETMCHVITRPTQHIDVHKLILQKFNTWLKITKIVRTKQLCKLLNYGYKPQE